MIRSCAGAAEVTKGAGVENTHGNQPVDRSWRGWDQDNLVVDYIDMMHISVW